MHFPSPEVPQQPEQKEQPQEPGGGGVSVFEKREGGREGGREAKEGTFSSKEGGREGGKEGRKARKTCSLIFVVFQFFFYQSWWPWNISQNPATKDEQKVRREGVREGERA